MARDVQVIFQPGADLPGPTDKGRLRELAANRLRVAPQVLGEVQLLKVSFDARRRERHWLVTLRAFEPGEEAPGEPATTPETLAPVPAGAPCVAVVGSGPAGLFAALELARAGIKAVVFERGRDVRTRRRALRSLYRGEPADPDSNYCFGEGGAGTYSDGKLYTRSGSKKGIRRVLATLVSHGAPREILVAWRPHVGSNRLPDVVASMRESLRAAGGEVRFGERVEEIQVADRGDRRAVRGVVARDLDSGTTSEHAVDAVILATGHSALDALTMAQRAGARLLPKGFAMGVRIEHPQPFVDDHQYGGLRNAHALPAAFYELTTQVDGRGVYSFCMCPGGFIVPAATGPGRVVVNGMSLSRRDSPFANSGLVVALEPEDWCGAAGEAQGFPETLARARALGADLGPGTTDLPRVPEDDPLFGVKLQHALESLAAAAGGGRNRVPSQRADLVALGARQGGPALPTSYRPGVVPTDLATVLPAGMMGRLRRALRDLDAKLPGFASESGQLLGVETRTSSPVRIARDPESLANPEVDGLYPCGEGAGYAGGIVSAALDGERVAVAVARHFARA